MGKCLRTILGKNTKYSVYYRTVMTKPPVKREEVENEELEEKIDAGKEVVKNILEEHGSEKAVIGFTGGKDSTLTAWIVKQVCEENGFEKPRFMFIDHGQHFEDIEEYVEKISADWGFRVVVNRNSDLINKADKPGDKVPIEELDERNKKELKRVDEEIEEVPWLMDTEAGNHLLKTVPMNQFIEKKDIEIVINGVRWDEHESRENEKFYSPRSNPDHIRVHPILQFTEAEVWEATWKHVVPKTVEQFDWETGYPESAKDLPQGLKAEDLPISPKYWEGFRSLGSRVSTDRSGEKPAWLQDVESTDERAGRAQNKDDEEIMKRLRKMGYM